MTRFEGSLLTLAQAMPASAEGVETTISHTWPYPPWITLLLAVAALAYISLLYARERHLKSRLLRWLLVALRVSALGLVFTMLYGWICFRYRTDLPDLLLLVDRSGSMALEDKYDEPQRERVARDWLRRSQLSGGSRINLAKAVLLQRGEDWFRDLAQRYNVKLYLVGSRAVPQAVAAVGLRELLAQVEPDDTSSLLGKCLRDVIELQRGRPTAAIVLLTDGVTTAGQSLGDAAEYAQRKGIPLFLVGLGQQHAPRDVRISDLAVDEVVFVGDLVYFEVKLDVTGYPQEQITVRLRQANGEAVLAERTVSAEGREASLSVRLAHRPAAVGEISFVVEAVPLGGEVDTQNNRMTRLVSVRDETIRVLLVQDYPSYEFRYLKNLLERSRQPRGGEEGKTIELSTVLQDADLDYARLDQTALRLFPATRDELFRFDVVIFGDVQRSYLSDATLRDLADFVQVRGGGLVFIAGPRHTPLSYRNSPLEGLFPMQLSSLTVRESAPAAQSAFVARPTQAGLMTPHLQLETTPAANVRAWSRLPELYWLAEALDLRPTAQVLLEHPTRVGNSGSHLPVACLQFVGAGKVVFQFTDESWRWSRAADGQPYYARYWLQTIRYLSRVRLLGRTRGAELSSDSQQYDRGDPVQLRVRFFDERLAPPQDDGVTVMLESPGGQKRPWKLLRDTSRRGTFQASVGRLAEGEYRAWMAAPQFAEQAPSCRFSVVSPPGELAELEMNAADLQLAARTSSGRYYTMESVGELPRDLPPGRQVRLEALPPEPIWNSPWLAAAVVSLLAAEWLIRKRQGLF